MRKGRHRILDKSTLAGSIDLHGFWMKRRSARFRKAIDAPHGMIPRDWPDWFPARTTTLYSVLQELNSPQLQHRDG
jgi:hypothetical protein